MQYRTSRGFERILRKLHPREKLDVQRHVDVLVRALEARTIPHGLGVKKLRGSLWEFRIDLSLRVLFLWEDGVITFLFVGNHREVQLYLKHFFS